MAPSKMPLMDSRFVGYVFAHQIHRARALGGGVDAWLNDLFETYAYARALEKLTEVAQKLQFLTIELKVNQLKAVITRLKSNAADLPLEEIKLQLLQFYELMEEIEGLTGIKVETPEDKAVADYIRERLYDNAG